MRNVERCNLNEEQKNKCDKIGTQNGICRFGLIDVLTKRGTSLIVADLSLPSIDL